MREVLFRGKRIDTGEWVYGDLVHGVKKQKEMAFIWSETEAPPPLDVSEFAVDPSTIGQYTGTKDMHGNCIFEDDVFKDDDNECVGVVRWHNGSFKIFWYGHDGVMMPYGYDECAGKFGVVEEETFDDVYIDQMEVVGNIHDNPEFFMEV